MVDPDTLLAEALAQVDAALNLAALEDVRIAIAAAIGLKLGLRAQLVGLPSVAALETNAPAYLAIGDARRDTFYFTHVEDGLCTAGPLLATADELHTLLAAHSALPVFTSVPLPAFPSAEIALPSAVRLARLAHAGRGLTATGDLEPIYLREPHITQPKQ